MSKIVQILEGPVVFNPYGNYEDVVKGLYIGTDNIKTPFYDLEGKNVKVLIEIVEDSESSNLLDIGDEIEFDVAADEFHDYGVVSEIEDQKVIILVYNYETEQNELITFQNGQSWSECGQIRLNKAFNF